MRLFETGSFATPVRGVLDGLIVIVGALFVIEALLVAVLLINPQHPLKERFQVTTLSTVPTDVWPTDNVVRVLSGSSHVAVEPWAYIAFRPMGRAFVLVTAIVSFAWWSCVGFVLLQLRRALTNMSAGAPFPRANIRCIRRVGWGILGLAAVDLLMDAGMVAYMRVEVTVAEHTPTIPTAMLVADFPIGTIVAGLAIVILAEIFRAGADLQDDQALTV